MEPVLKRKKRRYNKKMDNFVPISLKETCQSMTKYESKIFHQIAIAESLGKNSVGNDG